MGYDVRGMGVHVRGMGCTAPFMVRRNKCSATTRVAARYRVEITTFYHSRGTSSKSEIVILPAISKRSTMAAVPTAPFAAHRRLVNSATPKRCAHLTCESSSLASRALYCVGESGFTAISAPPICIASGHCAAACRTINASTNRAPRKLELEHRLRLEHLACGSSTEHLACRSSTEHLACGSSTEHLASCSSTSQARALRTFAKKTARTKVPRRCRKGPSFAP